MKSRIQGASSLNGTGNVKYPHTQNLCQGITKTCASISDAAAGEVEKQQQGNTESKNKLQLASVRSGNRLKPLIYQPFSALSCNAQKSKICHTTPSSWSPGKLPSGS